MASERSKAHREALNEDVQAEQEQQERWAVLEQVATHLGPKHPICYDSNCLCNLSHEKKLETFSVAMLNDMLKYSQLSRKWPPLVHDKVVTYGRWSSMGKIKKKTQTELINVIT